MCSIKQLYDRTKKLRLFAAFDSLPEELLWELASKVTDINLKKDTVLLRPYVKNDTGYLILKGQVEVESPDDTIHTSKSSLKTLNTICGPIKIKSIKSTSNIILSTGEYLGFDSNIQRGGVYKNYVPSVFAKCKTHCAIYAIPLKGVIEVFQQCRSKTLDHLFDVRNNRVFLSVDNLDEDRSISFSKPEDRIERNSPVSRQTTLTKVSAKHPRNKSCLQNYQPPSQNVQQKPRCHIRSRSRDQNSQKNTSYIIHNIIMKKIRRKQQQSTHILNRRRNI